MDFRFNMPLSPCLMGYHAFNGPETQIQKNRLNDLPNINMQLIC